jgi:hypothetical protein
LGEQEEPLVTTIVDILRFITVFASGIGSAALWTVLVVAVPMVRSLPAPAGLLARRGIDPRMDRFNPICVILSMLAGIAILILRHNLSHTSGIFTTIGVVCMGIVIPLSLGIITPITHRMADWDAGSPPGDAASFIERWERFHTVRTVLALIGFAAYTIAALT